MKYRPTRKLPSLLDACRLQTRQIVLIITCLAISGTVLCTPALAVTTGPSGLPLPRYVSLKSERVNMRIGPGQAYQVQWLYVKRGLPMEIIQEYDNWRKVRDPEGNEGWVLHSLLSGQRTAIVAPWSGNKKPISMRRDPDESAPLSARLEPGVVVLVDECADGWCKLSTQGVAGFVDQKLLWGVYPGENF